MEMKAGVYILCTHDCGAEKDLIFNFDGCINILTNVHFSWCTLSWCVILRFWKCMHLLIILSSAVLKSAINCKAGRMLGTTITSIVKLLTHSNKFLVIPEARVCNYQLLMRSSVYLQQLTTQGIQLWLYMLCSLSMEMSKAN